MKYSWPLSFRMEILHYNRTKKRRIKIMITLGLILLGFLVIGIVATIITGLIAIFPITLGVLALILLDVCIFRFLFRKKKK